jgi:iron complex outermembrane recepter protein
LYDQWAYAYITPKIERINGFVRGTFAISNNLEAFAELSYNDSSTFFPGTPRAVGNGVGGTFSAATGRLNNIPTSLPATHPNNPTFGTATPAAVPFRYRFDVLGPQDNAVDSGVFRGLIGLKGYAAGWDFETGLLHNDSRITTYNYNEVSLPGLTQGITNGTFNFLNPSSGAVTAQSLRIDAVDESKSVTTLFDIKGSRELFTLPGGAAGIAIGAEYRREERVLDPDLRKQNGEIFGRGVARADSSRNVRTLYAELSAPIIKGMEVQLAARHDRYSDYGSSTTPKVALAYSPTTALKVRGSYAEGFRAPSLVEAGRSATSGFFNGVDDPRRCNRGAGITVGCGLSIPGLITGSNFLKAEDAKTYTFGFVFEPTNDTNLSIDYFNIKRRNEITFLSLDDILRNEGSTDARYANRIFRDTANVNPGVPNDPGAILYVLSGFDNLGKTEVSGLDFDVRRRFTLGSAGKLTSRLTATHYITQAGSGTPDDPVVSYNGMRNAPRTRAQFVNSWEYGAWTTTVTFNYLSSFRPYTNPVFSGTAQTTCANPTGTYLGICNVSEYYTFDLGVEYTGIKNLRANLTARNIANRKPSNDPLARPFNTAWYSPAGLTFVGGLSYTFR